MLRSSSIRERGSALIEALIIGSFVFLVVMAAISSMIEVAIEGGAGAARSRIGAVHAARHADVVSAESMAGRGAEATDEGDALGVIVLSRVELPHPDGAMWQTLFGRASMPLAPFRSARG